MTTHEQELDRYKAQTPKSRAMYQEAEKILPLGVSSNFRTYEPYPIYIQRAEGSKMWDVDGREYTDYSMCFGALMVGHSNPVMVKALAAAASEGTLYGMPHDREMRAAQLIGERFRLEQVRFTNSGSESTMHALRLARTYTEARQGAEVRGRLPRRPRHGARLGEAAASSSPAARSGPRRCPSATASPAAQSRTRWWRSGTTSTASARCCRRTRTQVAAIILEPVMMNVGVIPPRGRLPAAAARARDRTRRAPDLRRGEDRRQARLGRRAGVLRRQGRHGVPRQGDRRRPAARRLRRQPQDHGRDRAAPLVPRRHLREQSARHHRLHRGARADPHQGCVRQGDGARQRARRGPQQDHQAAPQAVGAP